MVVPNGVADLHGLKVYDSIEEIDNQPLQNVTHGRVVQYVESKNSVWLTICRKNQKEVIKELELKGRCHVEKRTGLLIKKQVVKNTVTKLTF